MSRECISPWELQHRSEIEKSRSEFENSQDFCKIVSEADTRGYRRITLSEQMNAGSVDAYSWRGGVWVKAKVHT